MLRRSLIGALVGFGLAATPVAARGAVLLTGDLHHFTIQVRNSGVPSFDTDRADTLASFARFNAIAQSLRATAVLQYEPDDIAKLPAFRGSAR